MAISYTGTKVSGTFSKLGELNAGKAKLDPQEEYIFELVETKDQLMKGFQTAEDKAAGKPAPKKVHAGTTWREIKSGVLVFQKFNIESLSWGNGPNDSKRSRVIKFMEDIGIPSPVGKIPVWDNVFIPSMKIRARVVLSTAPDEYFFKEGSFRKYQA